MTTADALYGDKWTSFLRMAMEDYELNYLPIFTQADNLMKEIGLTKYYLNESIALADGKISSVYNKRTKIEDIEHPKNIQDSSFDFNYLYGDDSLAKIRAILISTGKLLTNWINYLGTKWFFNNMDFFNKDHLINENWNAFKSCIKYVWDSEKTAGFSNNIQLKAWFYMNDNTVKTHEIISLWRSMYMDIDKTLVPNLDWSFPRHYILDGRHDIHYNPSIFNTAYLKNLIELSRKHIESIIDNRRIQLGIAQTELSITITQVQLWKHDKDLRKILDDHIKNYRALTVSFEDMKKANTTLQKKVENQDKLISELNEKLETLIKFFYGFKEHAPKEMLRLLMTTVEPLKAIELTKA